MSEKEKKQLVWATVNKMKYKIITEQFIKAFFRFSFEKRIEEEAVKLEPSGTFYVEDQNVLCGKSFR